VKWLFGRWRTRLRLPDVTLVGIDNRPGRLTDPLEQCTKAIEFGCVRLVTDVPIRTDKDYSRWVCTELYKHVPTSHLLIFQWDGYVKNAKAWTDEWLQYDYIGAPWWHTDGMNVGNGGFSLRSRRLMEIVATDPAIADYHPEDVQICRHYRPYLEREHGIRFAPEDVARRFSIEGYKQPNRTHTTEFGFHGKRVKFAKSGASRREPAAPRIATVINYCTNEYRFIRQCIAAAASVSTEVIVPIADHFFDGMPENAALVAKTQAENPEATFISYPWTPGQRSRYWHNYSRLVGAQHVSPDVDWVMFLDADEIVEPELFMRFARTLSPSSPDSFKLANYWYFREPIYRATTLEDGILVVRRARSLKVDLDNNKERNQFVSRSTQRMVTVDGRPIGHHFSWVRSKEEMLRKVRSWGHNEDKRWDLRVEAEFSRPFNGKSFVNDYEFVEVEDVFGLGEGIE
jgi:hypothetical protein